MASSLRPGMACCILWALSLPLFAQQPSPQLTRIEEDEANIRLDGFIDEAVWDRIPVFDGMKVIEPDTLAERERLCWRTRPRDLSMAHSQAPICYRTRLVGFCYLTKATNRLVVPKRMQDRHCFVEWLLTRWGA